MGHQTPIQFFLRNIGYERNSFCNLTVVKTDHGKLVTGRQLRSSTTVVVVTSGDAPAPWVASVVVTQEGAPPPSVESALEFLARRIDGVS
jgi:hypothetical protein